MLPLKIMMRDQMDYKELLIQQKKSRKKIINKIKEEIIAVGDFLKLK